jgi:hypothetical protein
MSNIPAKDANDALVPLATHLIGGEHHGAYLPSDPGTGAPFKAADDATLAALSAKLPALGQKDREGSVSFTLSSEDEALLGNILQALAPLMSARGVDGSLRIQSQGGTITTITTVGTVTTVTTVTTVGNVANQTAIGGLQATPQIPALMNLAAASNIDRMVG